MSYIPTFKSAGAQSVAGSLILNRETVLILRNGVEILTPEGEAALTRIQSGRKADVQDVEAKSAPAPKKTKKAAAPAEPPPPADPVADLDDLLTDGEK